jgi:glycosyltransferase involved in cell wall biosynthesis
VPRISVLMPVYNAEAYVSEAIASILHQSYADFELLVIDDGSQDGSMERISSFTDNRIKLIRHSINKGLVVRLNEGLAVASGDYIARMDADDISTPDRLRVQIDFMEQHPQIGVCGSRGLLLGTNVKWGEALHPEEAKCRLLFRCCMIHPTVMIRRRALQKSRLCYEESFRHAEDYRLWSELVEHTAFSNLPDLLLSYRLHEQQVSQQFHELQLAKAQEIQRGLLGRLGLAPTEEECEAHWSIGLKPNRSHPGRDAWIQKLIQANTASQNHDPYVFARMLSECYQ